MRPALRTAAAAAAALLLSAYTWNNGIVTWEYFGTPTGPTHFGATGAPTLQEFTRTLPAGLPRMPADLLSKVGYTLPEGRDIRTNVQGLMPDSDDKTNVRLAEDAEVWVTFVSEGAGYRNSVGYFIYDPLNPPRYPSEVQEKILFANTSMPAPLDAVSDTRQNTLSLGVIPAGKAVGFMVVSNGFSETGRSINGVRVPGVKDKPNSQWVFYTLRHLNPEPADAANLNVHTVVLKDMADASPGYQRLVIGFEDINRAVGGDHDFNDVVLAIHVTPQHAIANLDSLQPLVTAADADRDGDGVKDALDAYPEDGNRAFDRFYPSRDTWGTLAYEDLWPRRGDYDMNDMIVRYRSREVMNAQRQVVAMEVDYRLDARGASIESGFAVRLPGVPRATVASAQLVRDGQAAFAIQPESGIADASFIVFDSAHVALPGPSAACPFANTQAECPTVPVVAYRLVVNFNSAQASSRFSPPYDPFIFRTAQRGHEVHLPGRQPTEQADGRLFGSGDDRTSLNTARTYVDGSGRPWAMELPAVWRYPNETIDLTTPYPNMAQWATSGGTQHANWYISATHPKWLWSAR
jgi:LruC domain-containing protein